VVPAGVGVALCDGVGAELAGVGAEAAGVGAPAGVGALDPFVVEPPEFVVDDDEDPVVYKVALGRHWHTPPINTGKTFSGQQLTVAPILHTLSIVGSHAVSPRVTLLQVSNSTQALVAPPEAVTFCTQTKGEAA